MELIQLSLYMLLALVILSVLGIIDVGSIFSSIEKIIRKLKAKRRCSLCQTKSWKSYEYKDKYYCSDCAIKNFKICKHCNQIADKFITFKNKKICKNCFKLNVKKCYRCDKQFFLYRLNHFDNHYYCQPCHKKIYRKFKLIRIPFKKNTAENFKKNKFKDYAGVEVECVNNNRNKNCFIVDELKKLNFSQITDGSLDYGGVEFYSNPLNGDNLLNTVTTFCNELNKKDYYVTKHCGLHVHIQVDKDVELLKKMYLFYEKFEKSFYNMLPRSRQNNSFCEKFGKIYGYDLADVKIIKTTDDFKSLLYETDYWAGSTRNKYNDKRYCWINFHSIFYRGTVEIRAHSGTINPIKINNWLLMHLTVLDFLKKKSLSEIDKMKTDKKSFLKIFSISLQNYIEKRWRAFSGFKLKKREVDFIFPIRIRR